MKLTKNIEYGITALAFVAQNSSGRTNVKSTAERTGLPQAMLAKIFQNFARAGLLRSEKGKGGGYALALSPDEITLADIFNALAEPVKFFDSEHRNNIFTATFENLDKKIERIFIETKLSDLIKNYKENIMKRLDEILQNKVRFFQFMSKKFPVKYKSNIFLRDVQFAIKDYFDQKNVKLSYTETENMAKELMAKLVEAGEAEQLTNKSWEFLIKLEE